MKVRNGFVSNSSSTSFLIYGVCINLSDLQEMIEDMDVERKKYILKDRIVFLEERKSLFENKAKEENRSYSFLLERMTEELEKKKEMLANLEAGEDVVFINEEEPEEDMENFIDDYIEGDGIQVYRVPDFGELFIGESPTKMDDNERMIEWKQRVANKLQNVGININEYKLEWHEECWRDG